MWRNFTNSLITTRVALQVKQVYNVGLNADGFGRQLTALFRQAVTAGKRVRSETSIASGAVSVSSAAAELAQLKLPSHEWADAKARSPAHLPVCPHLYATPAQPQALLSKIHPACCDSLRKGPGARPCLTLCQSMCG